jgi:large subunit ribosomal protein L7Ae
LGTHPVSLDLNHIVTLVEAKKAALAAVTHNIDPLEFVVVLLALRCKTDVPYVVVKGEACAAEANLYVLSFQMPEISCSSPSSIAPTNTMRLAVNGVEVITEIISIQMMWKRAKATGRKVAAALLGKL